MNLLSEPILRRLYLKERKSAKEISVCFKCSENKINYWLDKHNIKKRSISEASYLKWNPNGDPFKIHRPNNIKKAMLFGLGLGLYWGEGNKRNKYSIRLGNTDPALIRKFLEFLEVIYEVDKSRIKFGLQIFNDLNPRKVNNFWIKQLQIEKDQIYKPIVTISNKNGNYKNKSRHGVITLYMHNKKLRDELCRTIEKL